MKPFILALLLSAPVSVPVAVNPPTPPGFTQQVAQSVTINGQAYTVSGTLTFTPVIQTGWLNEWPLGTGVLWQQEPSGRWKLFANIYPWEIPGSVPGLPFPLSGGPG